MANRSMGDEQDRTAGGVVKSAGRAFEVLELFRRERSQLTAAEIGQALGYPKSSTNALLKSLMSLGYLVMNARTLRYFPALRVARLGDWIPTAVLGSGEALAVISEVHSTTQETVTLCVQNDLSVNFLKVIPGTFLISLSMTEGFVTSVFGTAVGTAILSQLPDDEVVELTTRGNARTRRRTARVDVAPVLRAVREARQDGYAVMYDAVFPDTGAIALPFPSPVDGFPMAIGVGGLRDRIRRNEKAIVRSMQQSMTRHLGRTQTRRPGS